VSADNPGGGPGPGQVLFEFVRHWSRRWAAGSAESGAAERGRLVLVTEAVLALGRRGGVTVNAVADEIGIDQSGASRLVNSAVAAGYLRIRASRTDGRRREVSVTPAGISMLDDAHQWQEKVFAALTVHWTDRQRSDFRQAMVSLLDRSHAVM
jgi:MarR family transcriptional regulator, organic hydroperoxide resistance regulator